MRANTFWQIESCSVSLCEWWQRSFVFYEGVKLPEMERSRISNWSWCHFPNGAAGVPCPLDRVGHHDRDRRLSPLMTSTLASRAASLDLASFALLPYFPPPMFFCPRSTVFGTKPPVGLKTCGKISLAYSQEQKKLVKQIIWVFIAARFQARLSKCFNAECCKMIESI